MLSDEKLALLLQGIVSGKNLKPHTTNVFKLAMMDFNQSLFLSTYNQLILEKSFKEIFNEIFIPLLNEIGILWQTNTITPAHEHFISCLIRQKLQLNIENLLSTERSDKQKTFILYLPENESNDLGLMYLNYEILLNGYQTVYLGSGVSTENLKSISKNFDNAVYVSYLSTVPEKDEINNYLSDLQEITETNDSEFWLTGRMAEFIDPNLKSSKISVIYSIADFVKNL